MKNELDVKKITRQLEEVEKSNAHRKGTFKIEAPFEKAIDVILKRSPSSNPKTTAKKQ